MPANTDGPQADSVEEMTLDRNASDIVFRAGGGIMNM